MSPRCSSSNIGPQVEQPPHGNQDGDDQRQAGVNRTGDKVGRKYGRVPSWHDGHREVPRHYAVYRDHQRRGQPRQENIRRHVVPPLPIGSLPALRQEAVELLAPADAAVAHDGQIRDHAREEEQDADRHVSRYREHIPDQRRPEVREKSAHLRVGKEPVGHPRAAQVDQREQARRHQREDRHRLRAAIDRGAPAHAEKEQHRRDQGAGMRDSNPEHEQRDIETPADRVADAGNSQPPAKLHAPGVPAPGNDERQDHQNHVVGAARRLHGLDEFVVNPPVRQLWCGRGAHFAFIPYAVPAPGRSPRAAYSILQRHDSGGRSAPAG